MPRRLMQVISWVSLIGTILPSILFLAGQVSLESSKHWLLAATIIWFIVTPLWMGRDSTAVDGASAT